MAEGMVDVSAKAKTKRKAVARATVVMSKETADRLERADLPKGDPLPVARVSATMAVKNTWAVIPYCHPMPVEHVGVEFDRGPDYLDITVSVTGIYRTGVEMEALYGASVAALTIYDMLKPVDDSLAIRSIELVEKRGGKSDFHTRLERQLRAAVLVASDSISRGEKTDESGRIITERLRREGIEVADYRVVEDDRDKIEELLLKYADEMHLDLVLTTGGTGLSPRDHTPEATSRVLERSAPGIGEAMRAYGQERTPFSMLSRGISGVRGRTMIVNLPGSRKGVRESLDALFPGILHGFKMLWMGGHNDFAVRE